MDSVEEDIGSNRSIGPAVNQVLGLLEQPVEGTVAERRRRLKWIMGVLVQGSIITMK
jgi:hypothetical protein